MATSGYGGIFNHIEDTLAAGGDVNLQPAAQNEWIIFSYGSAIWTGAAPNGTPDASIMLYDGANSITVACNTQAALTPGFKLGATNAIYIRLHNNNAAGCDVGCSGVQTK